MRNGSKTLLPETPRSLTLATWSLDRRNASSRVQAYQDGWWIVDRTALPGRGQIRRARPWSRQRSAGSRRCHRTHLLGRTGKGARVVESNRTCQSRLGHSDTRMTERHYAHLSPNYVAETVRAHFPTLGIGEDNTVVSLRSVLKKTDPLSSRAK
jgi:hypothetical protein